MEYPSGHLYGRTGSPVVKQRQVFRLNDRLNVPLHLKENYALNICILIKEKDTSILVLKIILRGWACMSGLSVMAML